MSPDPEIKRPIITPDEQAEPGQAAQRSQPGQPGEQVANALARLGAGDEDIGRPERARLFSRLVAGLVGSARAAGAAAVLSGRWLADTLVEVAPRIPVRDLETLQRHHGGLTGEALADALVRAASRAAAAMGAAGGGLSALQYAAPPSLLTAPFRIMAETLVVAAIEVKLIAELHEVYGVPVPGTGTERGIAYVQAWAARRGVDPTQPSSLVTVLSATAKHRLRRRIAGRVGRNLSSIGPFFTGAVAGGWVNHAETRRIAEQVRDDLRRRMPTIP
jgi:hypothetical protein